MSNGRRRVVLRCSSLFFSKRFQRVFLTLSINQQNLNHLQIKGKNKKVLSQTRRDRERRRKWSLELVLAMSEKSERDSGRNITDIKVLDA